MHFNQLRNSYFYKPGSELYDSVSAIEACFKEHPPAAVREAGSKIEELTGIERSLPQVRRFMKPAGLNRRKAGTVQSEADLKEQELFKQN